MEILKKTKSNPITSKQKDYLVEYISARREMYTGKLTPSYTKEKMQQQWKELTNILNSVPDGPAKEWKQWRKTWVDLKKNTKAKYVESKKYTRVTGGGPPQPSTDMDEKLLSIITPVAISGNPNITESEVIFDFDDADINETLGKSLEAGKSSASETIFNIEDVIVASKEEKHNEKENNPHDHDSGTSFLKRKQPVASSTPTKKKRLTKTMRLQEALQSNAKFLKLNEENIMSETKFREQQIEIMLINSKNKEAYYERKLAILQSIANSANQMSEAISQIV